MASSRLLPVATTTRSSVAVGSPLALAAGMPVVAGIVVGKEARIAAVVGRSRWVVVGMAEVGLGILVVVIGKEVVEGVVVRIGRL